MNTCEKRRYPGVKKKISSNMSCSEYQSMMVSLQSMIIIHVPAEKISETVVINKNVDQLENEFMSSASYDEVNEDKSKQITGNIRKLVNMGHGPHRSLKEQ